MVPAKTTKCKTLKVGTIIVTALLAALVALDACLLYDYFTGSEEPLELANVPELDVIPDPEIPKIDFQPIIDSWVASVGGNKSVIIYDLDRDEMAGTYNPDEYYNTASLYKLFVVYEGYRRVESGAWNPDETVGGVGYTISKCLDLAIRESYSPCAERLLAMIGRDELNRIIAEDYDIHATDITRYSSSPSDILKIMKRFYDHSDIKNQTLIDAMKDSFLVQPPTTYNWRQGLPSGFKVGNVYNKVGWDFNPDKKVWNIYHDAAIVEFPEQDRNFIVVVMSNFVPFQRIRDFGAQIEQTTLSS